MIVSVLEVDVDELSKNKCSNCKVQYKDSVDLLEILSVLKQKFIIHYASKTSTQHIYICDLFIYQ